MLGCLLQLYEPIEIHYTEKDVEFRKKKQKGYRWYFLSIITYILLIPILYGTFFYLYYPYNRYVDKAIEYMLISLPLVMIFAIYLCIDATDYIKETKRIEKLVAEENNNKDKL